MSNHHLYEIMKADWIRSNPKASHEEYQAAMRELARKCGI